MANYNKYDARLESLVVEFKTRWDPETHGVADEDKARLAAELHRNPEAVSSIHYERMHTGFAREITITPADVERLTDV